MQTNSMKAASSIACLNKSLEHKFGINENCCKLMFKPKIQKGNDRILLTSAS